MNTAADLTAELAGRAVERVRASTGVEVAFAAVLDSAGKKFEIRHLAGTRTARLAEVVAHAGAGVGGRCIRLRRPVQVSDYLTDRTITHEFDAAVSTESLRSVFAVPFLVGGALRGAVYGASRGVGEHGGRLLTEAAELADCEVLPKASVDYRGRVQEAQGQLRKILATVHDRELREQLDKMDEMLCGRPVGLSPDVKLSRREIDVLALISLGYNNADVAVELSLSLVTVKSYLRSAMAKLGSRNRMEAVRSASRLGYLA